MRLIGGPAVIEVRFINLISVGGDPEHCFKDQVLAN